MTSAPTSFSDRPGRSIMLRLLPYVATALLATAALRSAMSGQPRSISARTAATSTRGRSTNRLPRLTGHGTRFGRSARRARRASRFV
jgi:hypothetical protein